ncbi:MAG: hopanoid biosynthesis-associated protein HpnK, partial [Candidatus Binatia bacterium]|nr:hopanoid biosynthesis-associated protein HpnK [Candidatus Binatia bacterium]
VIPRLGNGRGELCDNLVAAGFRFFFLPAVRRQLEAEIRAQFVAFQHTGLPLDHVNAHKHMHLHPTVLSILLRIGQDFGLRAVRAPYEPFVPSWRAARTRFVRRACGSFGIGLWSWLLKTRLRRAGIKTNDFVFGLHDTGAMDEATVLRLLRYLPEGVTELYFHPATRRSTDRAPVLPVYKHEEELAALVSPRVRAALEQEGIRPVGFCDL